MIGSLTTKHKIFLVLLSLFLSLTVAGRFFYSKHLHGLLCAARTFHRYASSDSETVGNIETYRDFPAPVRDKADKSKEDIADQILEIQSRLHEERKIEEEAALKNGIMSRRKMKQMKKKNKPRLTDPEARRVLPQAIIIGVRKCGTRALLEMLETHPQIAACGPEVHFFDKYYNLGLDWYRQQMKPSLLGQITIEKTPSYFITESAPKHIYAMNKDVKLLVIVRDPTTRVISDFTQIVSKGMSKMAGRSFEEVVMHGREVQTSYKAVNISTYSKYIDRWLKFFRLDQMHFIDGDKLITNPLPEMKKVERFLGITDFISADTFYYNATSGFYCLAGDLNSKCLSSGKGREHPKVSEDVIRKLQDFFQPYNERFFQVINQRFDWP